MKQTSRPQSVWGWSLLALILAGILALELAARLYEVPVSAWRSLRFQWPWAACLALLLPGVVWTLSRMQPARLTRLRMSSAGFQGLRSEGFRKHLPQIAIALRVAALGAMILAFMRPQSTRARDPIEIEGIDILLTLDLSLSMRATDIAPNRFAATKEVVDAFVQRRPHDRIGAVVFGREAYTLLPLTTDKEAMLGTLRELELGIVDGRGTAIGNAVGTSLNRLRRSRAKSKVLILLTDGDSNSGNISPQQAAELASAMKVRIYSVLMGGESQEGGTATTVDFFGRPVWERGTFPVNPSLLRSMAERTGGEFFAVANRSALEQSFHAILDRLDRSAIYDQRPLYSELFPAFLWPALFFLLLEQVLNATLLRRWP